MTVSELIAKLEKYPVHTTVLVCTGQHDGVRTVDDLRMHEINYVENDGPQEDGKETVAIWFLDPELRVEEEAA